MRAGLKAGESVAIVGAGGGLGHLGVQFAKAIGLNVIAIDTRDEGLNLAKNAEQILLSMPTEVRRRW